jgi:hypothetical protein
MARSRLGLKVVGACALVLGLMALVASGAQAEVGAHWNVKNLVETQLFQIPNGPGGVVNLQPQLEIKEIANKTGTLEFTTKSGTLVKILCTEAKFDEGGLLQASGGISLGRMLYHGCLTFLNEKDAPSCLPKTAGQPFDLILTLKFKGLIVLDVVGGVTEDYVKFVPDEGKAFAHIELGEECAIGTLILVEAKSAGEGFWVKDSVSNTSFLEEKVEHLVEESLHGIIALGQPAVIEGSALVKLGPGHAGQKWGGTPG